MHRLPFIFFVLIATIGSSCSDSDSREKSISSPRKKSLSKLALPKSNTTFIVGDSVKFEIMPVDMEKSIDSITIDHKSLDQITFTSNQFTISTKGFPVGRSSISVDVFVDGKIEKKRANIILLSDQKVQEYGYRVVAEYPHDETAFIQGLFMYDDALFESTGQKGESRLQKVDLNSGKILQSVDIDPNLFGEGSSIYRDQIYMLTWHAGKGFVFDKSSFEVIREFNYPTEGWGLTIKEDTFLMSDGSENIYFMEPEGFTEVRRLQVYDSNGPIKSLNELEFIDGLIYANQWLTEYIYMIDPQSGKAVGRIDLSGILDKTKWKGDPDVLNGIAYDRKNNRIFVTGKLWPRLFEVEFIKTSNPL